MLLLAIVASSCRRSSSSSTARACRSPSDERRRLRRRPSSSCRSSPRSSCIGAYVAGLIFSLRTHRDLFNPQAEAEHEAEPWSVRKAVGMLALAGVAVGVMSEILVGSISETAEKIGHQRVLHRRDRRRDRRQRRRALGRGLVARKDKMDLAVNISIGSSAQIALFVAPVLVLAVATSIGAGPMPLVFNGFELGRARARRADRQPGDPGRRVDLVRGPPAAGRLRRSSASRSSSPDDRVLITPDTGFVS